MRRRASGDWRTSLNTWLSTARSGSPSRRLSNTWNRWKRLWPRPECLHQFDETLYFLEVPTDDPEVTETAFQILSDWAYAISFDPEEVDLERGVILEEWRLSQGFNSRLQDNLLQLLFGSSRYAVRAPIGLTEVIESATAEDLRGYYERWYRPDLMAVVAVGDFENRRHRGQG